LYWWATAGDIFRIAYLFFGFNPRDSLQIFLRGVSDGRIKPSLTRPQGLSSHNVGNNFTLRKEKSPNRPDYYRRGDFFLAF